MSAQMPDHNKNHTVSLSVKSIMQIILAGFLLVAAYQLRDLVLVLLTAIVISSFIETFVKKMGKIGVGRTLSVVIFFLLSFFILAAIFYLFVPVLVVELTSIGPTISHYLPTSDTIKSLSDATSGTAGFFSKLLNGSSLTNFEETIKVLVSSSSGGFFQALYFTFGGITNLVLVVVISFLLSVQENGIENFLHLIISPKYEDYIVGLWERAQRKIGLWFQGQLLLGIIVGTLIFLGLSIFGVKYALVLALITALLELIPFGMILAMVPAIFFSYLDGGFTLAAIVTGFYFIVHQFESYLIAPLIVKKIIGISPLAIILSILIGLQLAGFWGVILAVPVAVFVIEYASDVQKNKALAKLSHE
jgi:predicted PurR-regulated permease PerM